MDVWLVCAIISVTVRISQPPQIYYCYHLKRNLAFWFCLFSLIFNLSLSGEKDSSFKEVVSESRVVQSVHEVKHCGDCGKEQIIFLGWNSCQEVGKQKDEKV